MCTTTRLLRRHKTVNGIVQDVAIKFLDWCCCIHLGGSETNYCHLSVVLHLNNVCQGSENPITRSYGVGTQRVMFLTAVMKQRVTIKFCVKLDKTRIENFTMLQTVYGDEAWSRSCVFEWFKRCKYARELHQDDPRIGRPLTTRNADTIANVCEMVIRDRRLTQNDVGWIKRQ
jgi:hypothetical protein